MINTYTIDKPNFQIALAATKIDLLKNDYSCLEKAMKLAASKGWLFYKTSAKLNHGVNELFEGLILRQFNLPCSHGHTMNGQGVAPLNQPKVHGYHEYHADQIKAAQSSNQLAVPSDNSPSGLNLPQNGFYNEETTSLKEKEVESLANGSSVSGLPSKSNKPDGKNLKTISEQKENQTSKGGGLFGRLSKFCCG